MSGCFDASSAIDATTTTFGGRPRRSPAGPAAGCSTAPSASWMTPTPESSANSRHGEAASVGDERVAHAHRQELARGAHAHVAGAVGRGRGVLGLTRAVPVVHGVERVVVAVEEVPARDVVDVAVVVVVDVVAVRGAEDEVLGVGDAVPVEVGDRAEVGDVEDAVVVAVAVGHHRVAGRLGLAEVDVGLGRQLRPSSGRATGSPSRAPRYSPRGCPRSAPTPGRRPSPSARTGSGASPTGPGWGRERRALVVVAVELARERARLVGGAVAPRRARERIAGNPRGRGGPAPGRSPRRARDGELGRGDEHERDDHHGQHPPRPHHHASPHDSWAGPPGDRNLPARAAPGGSATRQRSGQPDPVELLRPLTNGPG